MGNDEQVRGVNCVYIHVANDCSTETGIIDDREWSTFTVGGVAPSECTQ